jgi:hypothetical protein
MTFRFCVLSAVSTEAQATEEKDSLDYQYRTARAYGDRMGGTFTREYRADGFSRSGYYDLTQALDIIPAFFDLARDARSHLFDVILMESYDRLGDLGYMWFNYLSSLGPPYIQLRSVQQALPIDDPARYHPRRDDSTPTMINNSLTINRYRTSKIVRAFQVGNPKRAESGRYAMRWGMGYIKKDKDTIVIDPMVAPLVAQFPAWLLSGCTIEEIRRRAAGSGINPGRGEWSARRITYILESPFYAGKVYYDRKHGGQLHDGNHESLWSWDTHLKILAELARRRERPRMKKNDYNFTSLIACSECDGRLRIGYSSTRPNYKYWYCPDGHVTISARQANKQVAAELRRLYQDRERGGQPMDEPKDFTQRKLQQIAFEVKRLEQAYYQGEAYTPLEFAARKKELDARRDALLDEKRQKDEAERRQAGRERARLAVQDLLPYLEKWIENEEPRQVAYLLGRIVRLTAYPDKTIQADHLRE